jgi:DnaK suppressor protein
VATKVIPKAAGKASVKTTVKPPVKTPVKTPAKKAVSPKPVAKKSALPPAKTPAKSSAKAVDKKLHDAKAEKVEKALKPPKEDKSSKTDKPNSTPAAKAEQQLQVRAEDSQKKSPRAAKAISLMPPPPGQMVASTTAKASYIPMSTPQLPNVIPVTHKKDAKLANNWKTKPVAELTDAEVLSMSDAEYMNDAQLAFFRLKLVQLKSEILANAEGTTEHLREDTVVVPDPADRATIEEEHALELRTRDRERKLLKKIEQSIARIDAGDYGYCDETGEPIGVGRLLARPTATLSLEAQQRRELKQKMFGD